MGLEDYHLTNYETQYSIPISGGRLSRFPDGAVLKNRGRNVSLLKQHGIKQNNINFDLVYDIKVPDLDGVENSYYVQFPTDGNPTYLVLEYFRTRQEITSDIYHSPSGHGTTRYYSGEGFVEVPKPGRLINVYKPKDVKIHTATETCHCPFSHIPNTSIIMEFDNSTQIQGNPTTGSRRGGETTSNT